MDILTGGLGHQAHRKRMRDIAHAFGDPVTHSLTQQCVTEPIQKGKGAADLLMLKSIPVEDKRLALDDRLESTT